MAMYEYYDLKIKELLNYSKEVQSDKLEKLIHNLREEQEDMRLFIVEANKIRDYL